MKVINKSQTTKNDIMKTVTLNLYQFSELTDKAKEKAISRLMDINTDSDWWDSTYEEKRL